MTSSNNEKFFVGAKRLHLKPRQLCDLELLLNGGFAPLDGFLEEGDYQRVVEEMRLQNGALWPIPVVLDVDRADAYRQGESVLLCDEYGTPLAVFTVNSIYKPDKVREAEVVYKTTDPMHFGVRYLFEQTGEIYLGGKVEHVQPDQPGPLGGALRHDFRDYRKSPAELREWFRQKGWSKVIGFQTRNPLHRAHFALMKKAADEHGAKVLIHPSVGLTKDGDIDHITRVRSYIKLVENYMRDFAALSLLPLAMRMAGPREALWHAIVRKNYGCTHFIVGRDHAGPGNNREGRPFYGPYDAQDLVSRYGPELGIQIVPFKEMVYVSEKNEYIPVDQVHPDHTVQKISGTEFRQKILNGESIPEWFSFPEVLVEVKRGILRQKKEGLTVFFTGLPAAGKSTLASLLYFRMLELQDKKITFLDGDVVRQNLSKGLGFSREDRNTNIRRIGFVANEVTRHGGIAICSAIAPYEESRRLNRELISNNGAYVEIYVSTPLEICRQRDRKGFYKKTELGLMSQMTGIDDPYEVPANPDLVIDTSSSDPEACVMKILDYLVKRNLLKLSR